MPSKVEQGVVLPESGSNGLVADFGSAVAVIITHPWGPLGGNMHNNVVTGVAFWFQRLKVTTMRFDFAGLQIGRGYRQVQQIEEVANFLLAGHHVNETTNPHNPNKDIPKYILLVGYSYGSIIAASASSSIPRCVGVVSIAPPLAVRHWLFLFNGNYHLDQSKKRSDLPRLMVIGSHDNFTSEQVFMDIVQTMPKDTTTGAVLRDADHFFRRREKDLMDIIGHWLLSSFPQCNGDMRNLANANFVVLEDKSDAPVNPKDLGYGCNPCNGPVF